LSEFGEILNVTVGNKNGKSLGYAFVEFKNRSDAEKAFERVNFLFF
jgi:RNA recognition motif-containing protein